MDNLRRLGNSVVVPITADAERFTGRECPLRDCKGYFKIELGTGLKGENLPCHCPYCGHVAGNDHFWTQEQIDYAKSVARRRITDAVHKDLKSFEFDHQPKGACGVGISLKVKLGHPTPIRDYREKRLETEIVCSNCTLRYSVYGVFAFCPDCGRHNSLQILGKNLEVVGKMLDLATETEKALAERLIENALGDCVSAFDGFGRELCRIHANRASNPAKAETMRFQNLDGAKARYLDLFGIDLSANVAAEDWSAAVRAFQKRHLVVHKVGVVDQDYIAKSGDTRAVVGRKIGVDAEEVRALATIISRLAPCMSASLEQLEKTP